MTETRIVEVGGDQPYQVKIGRFLLDEVVVAVGGAAKVLVVHPVALSASAELLRERLVAAGFEAILAGVPDSEEAKNVHVAAFCWEIMGKADFTRTDAVIGFGGGSTTDLAGFVAATWLRGVKLVQVPTTLLGMVDAAIGGKTGINTAEGKNLVGCFYAPSAVVCDLETLESLPRTEILAGFGEVAKYGFIADERILELIEADVELATDPKSYTFVEIVERCVAIKARVVSSDFKEAGLREILNYGHTLGHAIEHADATSGDMAPPSPSAWSSLPSWPGSPDASAMPRSIATAVSLGCSVCQPPIRHSAGRNCSTPWPATRSRELERCALWCSMTSASQRSWLHRPTRCFSPPIRR